MEIQIDKNSILKNTETSVFLADAYYENNGTPKPFVIFVHGYKGYKDWGAWDLMAKEFAKAGFFFVKFNFSHNGTTINNPLEFEDLEAFGNNNYTKELSDLGIVIDTFSEHSQVDASKIILIGHSRGGGISIVKTFEDERINTLITLASVDTLDRFPRGENFDKWKEKGVYHIINGRTKQEMPHYFQFYKNFEENVLRLDVERAMEMAKANVLIVHGTNDEAVSEKCAQHLHLLNPSSELFLVDNANHTFGAKEPWSENSLPQDLSLVVKKCIDFIRQSVDVIE